MNTQELIQKLTELGTAYESHKQEAEDKLDAAIASLGQVENTFKEMQSVFIPFLADLLEEETAEPDPEPDPEPEPDPDPIDDPITFPGNDDGVMEKTLYVYPKDWQKHLILENNTELKNTLFKDMEHVGISAGGASKSPITEGIVVNNCEVDGSLFWGSRMHNVGGVVWDSCQIRKVNKEHGIYANVSYSEGESLTVIDTLIEDVGGQGVQTVWRATETHDLAYDDRPGGTIGLYNVTVRKAGHNYLHGRNAYAYTFGELQTYEAGSGGVDRPGLMSGCELDNTMLLKNRGMLSVTPRSRFEMTDSVLRAHRSDQTTVLLKGIDELIIRNCHFEVDDPSQYDRIFIADCAKIIIEGCTGNLDVFIDKQLIGGVEGLLLTD